MRKKVIAANWKMNKLPNEAISFIEQLTPLVKDTDNEVVLCVPYIDLFYSLLYVQGTNIKIGAQNMHWEDSGECTGEISGEMLKAIGVEYVILGHSYRRQNFAETDEIINRKLKKALEIGLKPIVGISDNYEQRKNKETEEVITGQLKKILNGITKEQILQTIIAYEPVCAISTNKDIVADCVTSEDANNTIKMIRSKIDKMYENDIAEKVIIQYGESINSKNVKEFFNMSDIDGGIIGGASLQVEEFAKLVNFDK